MRESFNEDGKCKIIKTFNNDGMLFSIQDHVSKFYKEYKNNQLVKERFY